MPVHVRALAKISPRGAGRQGPGRPGLGTRSPSLGLATRTLGFGISYLACVRGRSVGIRHRTRLALMLRDQLAQVSGRTIEGEARTVPDAHTAPTDAS